MPVKRQLFVTPSSSKKAKTLTEEVQTLKRKVASAKPELRQKSYTVIVPANNSDPIPLIDPTFIVGDEFKLHRVEVTDPTNTTRALGSDQIGKWAMLYSPKQGFTPLDCLPGTSPNDGLNMAYHVDNTKCRMWNRKYYGDYSNRGTVSTNASVSMLLNPLEIGKKFSIPMKLATQTANSTDPTVLHNQIYYAGSAFKIDAAQFLYVTIWFTDS